MSEKAPPERERFGGASLCVGDEPKGPAECLHSRGLLATAIIECPQGMRRIGAAGLSRVAKTPCSIPGDEPKDRLLYEALERELGAGGMLNLYACIGVPIEEDQYLTRASELFHSHLGYRKVGEFHKCGYKFGRWYNMIWMEKLIGEHR